MAESTSPKGSSGDFAKKVQRQLSRSKEKASFCLPSNKRKDLIQFSCCRFEICVFSAGAAKAGKDGGEQRRPI